MENGYCVVFTLLGDVSIDVWETICLWLLYRRICVGRSVILCRYVRVCYCIDPCGGKLRVRLCIESICSRGLLYKVIWVEWERGYCIVVVGYYIDLSACISVPIRAGGRNFSRDPIYRTIDVGYCIYLCLNTR